MRIEAPVSHLDLLPTVQELLGLGSRHGMLGKSYAGLLSGGEIEARPHYFDGIKDEEIVCLEMRV